MKQQSILFNVVINIEEQYSIWPSYKPLPSGWKEAGYQGDEESCLQFIQKNWIDMRPASLKLAQQAH